MSSQGILELLKQQKAPQTNPFMEKIKTFIDTAKQSKDPNGLLKMISANNPSMQKAIDYVNANGGDPKTAFYILAKQNGIDPDDVTKLMKK